ncbi:MAG: putative transposase, partial [Methanofollis sp.]|nr:putative transposase [Methanofollis sp.]
DFLHKLSRQYVDTYATICVEDLNVRGLKEKGNSTGLKVLVRISSKSIPGIRHSCARTVDLS